MPERDYWALFESEKQGIMNWLIEGARLWIAEGKGKQGLRIPPCIYTANEEYREDMDVLGEFLSLYVEDAEDGYITVEELYGFYEEFCFNRVPDRYKIAKNRLSSQITDRSTKYKTTKRYIDGKQVRVVEGLREKRTARQEAVNRIVNSYEKSRRFSVV